MAAVRHPVFWKYTFSNARGRFRDTFCIIMPNFMKIGHDTVKINHLLVLCSACDSARRLPHPHILVSITSQHRSVIRHSKLRWLAYSPVTARCADMMQSRCSCCSTTLTSVLRVVILVSVHLVTGALWTHHAHVSGFLPARRYDGVVSTMAGVTPFIGKQLETEVTFRPHRYAKHKMRSIAADVAWSVCVCLLDTSVSHAKTAEPIEMPLGCGPGWSQGTMYHVGAPIPPGRIGNSPIENAL